MTIDLNDDEILQILKVIDESNFDELILETKDQKLVLRKSSGATSIQELQNVNLRRITEDTTKSPKEEAPSAEHKELPAVTPSLALLEEGLVAVKAPILGIFYATPRPGAPPFVKEGSFVTENDTVCTMEVMKVFNTVTAGVRGVVVKVCAKNGQTVEFGQTLFLIRPEGERQGHPEA